MIRSAVGTLLHYTHRHEAYGGVWAQEASPPIHDCTELIHIISRPCVATLARYHTQSTTDATMLHIQPASATATSETSQPAHQHIFENQRETTEEFGAPHGRAEMTGQGVSRE